MMSNNRGVGCCEDSADLVRASSVSVVVVVGMGAEGGVL